MKIPSGARLPKRRVIAAAGLGAALTMTMSGCILAIPEPVETEVPQASSSEQPSVSSSPAASSGTSTIDRELVDTEWTGGMNYPGSDELPLRFQFEDDGTLYIYDWGDDVDVNYDSPEDTWAVVDGELTIYLSAIEEIDGLTFTGAAPSDSSFELDGVDDLGEAGYTLTMSEQ